MTTFKIIWNLKQVPKWLSAQNLTHKAYLNVLAAGMDYGARLVVGFFINPLLVRGLGDLGYGVWQVLGRLIGYISPASGRPTQTLKWTLANQQASSDYQEKRRYVGSTVAVSFIFSPILAIFGGILAWFAPNWLDTPLEFSWSVRVAAGLLVANLIMITLVDIPRSVLEGENMGYKRMGLSATLVFIGGGLTALALYINTGLVGVAAATLATTLLTGILFLKVVHTYVHWFGIARPTIMHIRQFLRLSGWFLIWHLVMKLMQASDVVILGIFVSAELVTNYTLTKWVPESLVNVIALGVFGATPGLGGIIGSGNLQKAKRVRNEIMSFTWLLITIAGSTILMWNKAFLQLWVGEVYDAGIISTLLIIIMVAQFIIIRNDASIIDLTLNLRYKVLLGLFSAILSIVLASTLVIYYKMGIVGICLGFIAGRSILSLSYPLLIGRFLGIRLVYQLKSLLRPVIVSVFLLAASLIMVNFLTAANWIILIFSILLTLGIVSPVAFYTGLSATQRQQISERIQILKESFLYNR